MLSELFSEQEANLVVLETIQTKHLKVFSSLISKYETYSMNIKDIVQYLIEAEGDATEQEEIDGGQVRLLEEKKD